MRPFYHGMCGLEVIDENKDFFAKNRQTASGSLQSWRIENFLGIPCASSTSEPPDGFLVEAKITYGERMDGVFWRYKEFEFFVFF